MRRNAALAAAALVGAAIGALASRRRGGATQVLPEPGRGDPRADDLRRKLAEARTASVEEDEFAAAGMAGETIVDDAPKPPAPTPTAAPSAHGARPVGDEFEAMRRRIHEEGRAAAEEMRRGAEPSSG